MIDFRLIREFFTRYGSKITDPEGERACYGVLSPASCWDARQDEVSYFPAGFQNKCEFLLMTLNESGVVQKDASLQINGKCFHVLAADWYYYADRPLYLRAYLSEEETQ